MLLANNKGAAHHRAFIVYIFGLLLNKQEMGTFV